jgi:hypothetical protein
MPLVPLDSFGEVRGVDFGSTTVPPSGLQGLQHSALELVDADPRVLTPRFGVPLT